MTTAKYYIPSGRSIQKKDYSLDNKVIIRDSTSINNGPSLEFYTENKRQVYDKGGIYPDVKVTGDTISYVLMQLIRKSMIFDFTVAYHQKYPEWKDNPVFADSILQAFKLFLKEHNFKYECECSKDLERIATYIKKKDHPEHILNLLTDLENSLMDELDKEFNRNEKQIAEFLFLDMIEKYFDRKERDRISLTKDKQTEEALRILQNIREYQRILVVK